MSDASCAHSASDYPSVQHFLREQGKGGAPRRLPCPSPVTIYHAQTGERLDLPCKRRRCPACGPSRWRPRVMARLHAGLHANIDRYLVLLLTAPGDANRYYFNSRAAYYWHRFWTSANRWWPGLSYWKVAELQQRGHVHFHVIVRGTSFIDIEQLRRLAIRSGFGAWVGIRRPSDYQAGTRGAAGYLSKYLLKDYQRFGGEPNFVTMSRDWPTTWREPIKIPQHDSWLTEYELRRALRNAIRAKSIAPPAPSRIKPATRRASRVLDAPTDPLPDFQ